MPSSYNQTLLAMSIWRIFVLNSGNLFTPVIPEVRLKVAIQSTACSRSSDDVHIIWRLRPSSTSRRAARGSGVQSLGSSLLCSYDHSRHSPLARSTGLDGEGVSEARLL